MTRVKLRHGGCWRSLWREIRRTRPLHHTRMHSAAVAVGDHPSNPGAGGPFAAESAVGVVGAESWLMDVGGGRDGFRIRPQRAVAGFCGWLLLPLGGPEWTSPLPSGPGLWPAGGCSCRSGQHHRSGNHLDFILFAFS